MRVLHLFSNWKVTGPAEPVIHLVRALRALGVEAFLAGGRSPFGGRSLFEARAAELGVATITDWRLSKHLRSPFAQRRDVTAIRKFIDAERIELVHCHMLNDHHIGGKAARAARRAVPVLRSIYEAGKVKSNLRNRFVLPRLTDGIAAFSAHARDANRAAFALPAQRAWTLDGLVDLARFRPRATRAEFRARFGIPSDLFVLGIVTRIQARRRFDLILEAVRRARRAAGRFVFMVVGRGTHIRTVLEEPARALGIADMLRHVGYMTGDDYLDALGAMDAKIFLGGGTDETARAVREAMAMGVPVIAGATGMLPDIVHDGDTGLVAPLDVDALAAAIAELVRNTHLARRLGARARAFACERFAPHAQAQAVIEIYRALLEGPP
jgi:glycosyltransferase involved in cell wall biosynthesis